MREKRDMSGIAFKNDRRENERQPLYTGSCTIDGKDYWQSIWVKQGTKGKFLSMSYKPKDPPKVRESFDEDVDDDVPY